ncbi:hypothetical protein D3C71_1991220 [compost metagenome]
MFCTGLHALNPAIQRHANTADDHERCNIQRVIEQKSENAIRFNLHQVDTETNNRVFPVLGHGEVHPSEYKRESYESG